MLVFQKPREGPLPPRFDLSKKCKHHFRAEGHTLEECYQLRDRIQDLIDNKLIQFDNEAALNIITNPLPPHQEWNVNAIIMVKERVPNFTSLPFPWKVMPRALVQESRIDLKGIGTPRFDWGICSFCDNEDRHALFDCKVLRAQVQSLTEHGIISMEREIVRRSDCMAANLCPPITQLKTSCNAISVGSRKD